MYKNKDEDIIKIIIDEINQIKEENKNQNEEIIKNKNKNKKIKIKSKK